jgi:hypothetical protein
MQANGRPHRLDEELCNQICDLVSAGHPVAAVARLVGCNAKTIRRHAERDEHFGQLLRAAEFKARQDPVIVMQRAAGSNWRAAAWLLERSDPRQYGKQSPNTCRPEEVATSFAGLIETTLSKIDDEQARGILYKIMSQAVDQELKRLFLPPGAREQQSEREILRRVDARRTDDILESLLSTASSPLRELSPKSPASDSAINAEKNLPQHG